MSRSPRDSLRFPFGIPAVIILLVAAVAFLSVRPTPGSASDIPQLTGQITDLAGALPATHPELDSALVQLRRDSDVRLYALFVRGNDGLSATDFARQVWEANGLGGRDVLLVVATDEETARFWEAGGVPDITDAELRDLQDRIVGPLLQGEAYDQAVIAAADGLAEAEASPANPGPDIPQLSGSITDLVGVLSGQEAAPERAIRDLAASEGIDLFVLIVRDAEDGQLGPYADAVAEKNSLGGNDVLLAIHFDQQGFFTTYGSVFLRGDALPEITQEELRDIEQNQVGMNISGDFDFVSAIVETAEALAAAKHAEEIPALAGNITDTTGLLDGAHIEIQAAIEALKAETGVDFYVLFVKTTGNQSIADFAGRVVDKNDRLRGTYVLLTLAADDRTDVISKDPRLTEITREEILGFLIEEVDPLITQRQYVPAVLTAIEAVQRSYLGATPSPTSTPPIGPTVPVTVTVDTGAATASSGGGIPIVPVIAVVGGLIVALVVVGRVRRKVAGARRSRAAEAAQAQSIEELNKQANALLLEADDGMRDAAEEVGFAEAELGPAEVRSLREALELGKDELEAAFAIKQRLEDAEPETPSQQQAMLSEIVQRSQSAISVVADERRKLADVRDLERNAPALLKSLGEQAPALDGALAEASASYDRLQAYAESNWVTVKGNVEQATAALATAKAQVADGEKALAASDPRSAARSALAAQAALAQAGSLIDAVSHAERSLLELQKALTEDLAQAEQDLKAARKAVEESGAKGFEEALRDAEGDLRGAQALAIGEKPDLLTASRFAGTASATAAAVAANAGGVAVETAQEDHLWQTSLRDAESSVRRAEDVVGTRRDSVTAGNRARLAQAQKTLRLAKQMAERNSKSTAIVAARRAEALSRGAYDPSFGEVRLGFSSEDTAHIPEEAREALQLANQIMHAMTGRSIEEAHAMAVETSARRVDEA